MRAGSSVNIARDVSTLKHDIPGDVLDGFSLTDTFLTEPPPLVSVSALVSGLVPGCVAGIPTCEDVVHFFEAKKSRPHGNSERWT
jgi:hypothetical protein